MSRETGGPAFPVDCNWEGGVPTTGAQTSSRTGMATGMTLRDYFAAKALAGWWSSSDSMSCLPKGKTLPDFQAEACARFYEWADAMLAARGAE